MVEAVWVQPDCEGDCVCDWEKRGEWGSQDREPAGEIGGGEEDGGGWEDDPACVHQLQEFGMNDLYLVSLYLGIVWGAVELAAGLLGWK